LHRSRYLRHWTGADGAFRLDLYATPEAGAAILAGLAPLRAQAFAEARAVGVRERAEAYAADALEAMARASGSQTGEGTGGVAARGHPEGGTGETSGERGGRAGTAGIPARVSGVERLARLCRWHHHLKTYEGYRLEGGPALAVVRAGSTRGR